MPSPLLNGPPRVVVVVDGPVVPAAVARAIDRVAAAPVDLLGVHVRPRPSPVRRRMAVVTLVDRLERALYRPTPDALAPVDLRRSRADLTLVSSPAAADVVLDLTRDGLAAGDGSPVRGEVWSLRYGHERRRLGADAFVPEYLSGSEVGVCELLAERVGGQPVAPARVVYRSVSALDRLSPARSRNEAAWKAAEFPARMLTALATRGPGAPTDTGATTPAVGEEPRSHPAAALARTVLGRGLREAVRRTGSRPTWFVAIRTGGAQPAGQPGFDTAGFRALLAPPGRFYADPFVVARPEGGAYVFVEDGPLDGGPARISVAELDANGDQQAPARAVVERSTHLSYPNVFEDEGSWYMLPETAGTGAIELLRALEFPWRWEPYDILVHGVRAWDPTLLRHDGLCWLFANVAAPGARPSDELCLYSAPGLRGPWRPHPQNPVVSDVRRARPAGRILENHGCLLRPAQDGSGAYGRRIVLNRIDVLTPTEYREKPVGSIEPGWLPGVVRTHTYTSDGRFEALDGVRYERRPWFGGRRPSPIGG